MMKGEDLRRAGIFLFGLSNWADGVAGLLKVNPRTVERAAAGQRPIPAGWLPEIADALEDRANEMLGFADDLSSLEDLQFG